MSEGVTLIINRDSGHDEKEIAREVILQRLQAAGKEVSLIELSKGQDMADLCARGVQTSKEKGGLVVVAGGDGTVNMVASLCVKHDVPLGIIPMGTFNYFARNLQIPVALEEAVDVLIHGRLSRAPVGKVQDNIFLNNASFGLYTKIIRNREEDKSHFGRYRIVAFVSALRSLFNPARVYNVHINAKEADAYYRTTMVFAGLNKIQLESLGLLQEGDAADAFTVAVLQPATRFETLRLLAWSLLGNTAKEEKIDAFITADFIVKSAPISVSCAIDGEIVQLKMPLEFTVIQNALSVMTPVGPAAA